MRLRKYRWSKVYESSEEELLRLLAAKKIDAERWEAEGGEAFAPHQHPQHKTLWCAEGQIVFTVGGKRLSLQAGDVLELPADTVHEARAGFGGCVCYEYPPPAGNPTIPA